MKPHKLPDRREIPASELEMFNALLTPGAKARLKALAHIQDTAASQVVEDAFWMWWEGLPPETRKAAEVVASTVERARKKSPKGSKKA